MNKKYFLMGLAAAMSFSSVGVMASTVELVPIQAPLEKGEVSIHQINMNVPITRAEFIIAVINPTDEKMPQIMDTHYALPAMERAEALGLIDLEVYPMDTWSEIITNEEKSEILSKAMQNNGIDMGKVYTKLSQILVEKVSVDGQEVDMKGLALKHAEGKLLVPVRPVAEALGFEVTWNQDTYTATLNNGNIKSDVQVGFDMYCYTSVKAIGMSAPFSVGVAPKLIDDVIYVPVDYFDMFATKEISDSTLKFM